MPRRPKPAPPALWLVTFLALAVIVAAVFVVRGRLATTPATSFGANPANYSDIELPLDPGVIVDGWPQQAGDATRLYDLAADVYGTSLLTRRPYDDFLRQSVRRPADPGELSLLQHIIEAGRHSSAAPFADEPESLINYQRDLPKLDALYALGQVAIKQAGLLAGRNHPGDASEARRLYEAAFTLGVHLFQERLVHREMEYGYRLIGQSMGGLTALARKHEDAARANRIGERRDRFTAYVNTGLEPVWEKISAINIVERKDDAADLHFGDVLAIAQSDAADPMWRTEAILRLGKARHDAARSTDRAAAQGALEQLAANLTDPRLKLACEKALALTASERMNAR